jgi:signal transduction histidine kinase
MDISWLSKKIDLSKPEIKEKVDETTAMLDGAVKSVRKIATELRPSILDDLGLIAAMEWQCGEFEKKSGIKVNFACNSSIDSVPVNFNIGLFRILQESLTNIARHAAAKQVMVSLDMEKPAVTLKIKDDGCGFDINTIGKKKTLGLMGMKERTIMMGGVYEIDSQPGNGTTITLKVPLQQTETPV